MSGIPKQSEYSVERELVLDVLRAMQPGERVLYEELDAVAGLDVREKRHLLAWALKQLQAEGVLFRTARGLGLDRLTQADCVKEGDRLRARAHRHMSRALGRALCVGDVATLDEEQLAEVNASVSQIAALKKLASAGSKQAIRSAVKDAQHKLPSASVLRLFTGGESNT